MKCIVTTTIHSPSEAILKFCKKKDWIFIIIGDLKTPHEEYLDLERHFANVRYLSPDIQEQRYKILSDIIGWNSIDRRNIGFVEAYNMGANIIASVDDDNIPYDFWGTNVSVNQEIEVDMYVPKLDVFDPLSIIPDNPFWHRGYPIEYLQERHLIMYAGKIKRKVLVQADLWDGDPDIDAIARLIYKPTVKFDIKEPYCSNRISPFNSQNTFLSKKVFPYYACLPNIGRMDDIWGSYLFQHYYANSVIYSKPSVYQQRNSQDVIKNLEDELIGHRGTLDFIKHLNNFEALLPEKTRAFFTAYSDSFIIQK